VSKLQQAKAGTFFETRCIKTTVHARRRCGLFVKLFWPLLNLGPLIIVRLN